MNNSLKVLVGLVAFLVILGGVGCLSAIGFNNASVDMETSIKAQWDANQAVYDKTYKTVLQTANVADAHASNFKDVVKAAVEGRYNNDQQVLFKAIAEANGGQALPTDLFIKVQQVIESGNAEFLANQKELVSKKETYEKHLKRFPNSMMASVLGYPRIDLDKYKVVTSDRTESAFASGKDAPVLPFTTN